VSIRCEREWGRELRGRIYDRVELSSSTWTNNMQGEDQMKTFPFQLLPFSLSNYFASHPSAHTMPSHADLHSLLFVSSASLVDELLPDSIDDLQLRFDLAGQLNNGLPFWLGEVRRVADVSNGEDSCVRGKSIVEGETREEGDVVWKKPRIAERKGNALSVQENP
jgi:hypothetical protein